MHETTIGQGRFEEESGLEIAGDRFPHPDGAWRADFFVGGEDQRQADILKWGELFECHCRIAHHDDAPFSVDDSWSSEGIFWQMFAILK